ncbi:MAG TPA: 6-phosphogluconolactonase [Acidimicrobiales bacterium]|nr:6-phosphogluconolactonase [Acidimicrobiales bacterium]
MTTLPPPVPDVPAAFTQTVNEAFTGRVGPRFALILSGGPTARSCYEHLAGHATLDWSLVDIAMGDERVVAPTDPDANQQLVREALLDRIGPVGSFTPMPTEGPIDDCVARYQAHMAQVLAGPGIDLIHLGLGADGHTASLFPGAPTLDAGADELVAATEDPNGRNPHPRLTVTLPVIDAARLAVFTVTGASKQEAVASLRRGDDIPAARVAAPSIIWLVDAPASGHGP